MRLSPLLFALVLVACGDGQPTDPEDTGSPPTNGTEPVEAGVEPRYPGTEGWASCIAADGTGALDASGAGCSGAGDCLFAGLVRQFEVAELDSCAGVTARDTADALVWVCEELDEGIRVVSTGLEGDPADLIDFASASWRELQVIVEQDGTEVASSDPQVWWSSPVVPLPDATEATVALDAAETVYILQGDATAQGYNLDADSVTVLTGEHTLTAAATPPANCAATTGELADADASCLLAAGGQQCLWIGGSFDGGDADNTALLSDTHHSYVGDATFTLGGDGLELSGGSSRNLVTDVVISDQQGDGLVLGLDATANRLQHLLVHDQGVDGVFLDQADGNAFFSISVEDSDGDGWALLDSHDNRFEQVWSYGSYDGFYLEASTGNAFVDAEAAWTSDDGFQAETGSDDNTFVDVRARETAGAGFALEESSGNRVERIRLAEVGFHDDDGLALYDADDTVIHDAVVYNCGYDGVFEVESANLTVTGLLVAGCANDGFHASDGTEGLTLLHVTAVDNGGDGIEVHNTDAVVGTVVGQAFSGNNADRGLNLDDSTTMRVVDLFAFANGSAGVELDNMDDTAFLGMLRLGQNGVTDCEVLTSAAPGLEDETCANAGASTATLATGVDAAAAFVGPVTVDDAACADDTAGQADHDALDDWLSLEHPDRTWGRHAPTATWPDPVALTGRCGAGETCGIWDWSPAAGDTVLRDAYGTAGAGACPPSASGDQAITDYQTSPNTFLLHAVERLDDGIGDDDGLCESAEACDYTPNQGRAQPAIPASSSTCTFTDGLVFGVTLYTP